MAAAPYIGRFAPSPTGPLHFGSLMCALASYLDARAHKGRWLIRIEDVDTLRAQPGISQQQLAELQRHGMHSDETVIYQTERLALYSEQLEKLLEQGQAYACSCSRKRLPAGPYPGYCRDTSISDTEPHAVRVRVSPRTIEFEDILQGKHNENLLESCGDFIIRRKDGLFAYQLAVVIDDEAQGVNCVVRGADLLDSTARQIHLQQLLGFRTPEYLHVPIVVGADGHKLSKQSFATPVDSSTPKQNLRNALGYLRLPSPPAELRTVDSILEFAISVYRRELMPRCLSVEL